MSNDLVVPGIAGAPSKRFDDKPIEQERIGAGIGVGLGYSVIGASGKQFKLQHSGESYMLTEDSRECFDMIILRGGEVPSHTWYKQGYQPGSESSPDCQATDGIAPDDSVPPFDPKTGLGKQSDLCQTCPRHVWGMQKNGRKGRECSDSLRLAVFPVSQNLIEKAIGRRLSEPVMFRVPAASMKGLVEFMNGVRELHRKMACYGYVTRVKMRQDVPHAQYTYQVAAWLTDDQVDQMALVREEPLAYRILGQSPDGHSLVRAAANQVAPSVERIQIEGPPSTKASSLEDDYIAVQKEVSPQQAFDKSPLHVEDLPSARLIEDAPADMNALVAAMRPRPPYQE